MLFQILGAKLFEKKFALFIHTNEILRELWPYDSNKFQIKHGTVKFFENPELCYDEIQSFMLKTKFELIENKQNFLLAEISFNFNGYRRLTCSNKTIDLKFDFDLYKIIISWNVTITDLRRLKGFIISYIQVASNFTFDQNDVESLHSSLISSSTSKKISNLHFNIIYEWSYLYIQFDEYLAKKNHNAYKASIDVEPFTRYAIYLKADLTMDTQDWNYNDTFHDTYSTKADKLISQIHYLYSSPARKFSLTFFFSKKL